TCQDLDRSILLDRIGEVSQTAVDHHRHGLFAERLGNALSQRLAGDSSRKGPLGTVGKCQGDVVHALSSHSLPTKQVRWKSYRGPRNRPRASELVPPCVPPCQDGAVLPVCRPITAMCNGAAKWEGKRGARESWTLL